MLVACKLLDWISCNVLRPGISRSQNKTDWAVLTSFGLTRLSKRESKIKNNIHRSCRNVVGCGSTYPFRENSCVFFIKTGLRPGSSKISSCNLGAEETELKLHGQ
jgi:hypothetical protein